MGPWLLDCDLKGSNPKHNSCRQSIYSSYHTDDEIERTNNRIIIYVFLLQALLFAQFEDDISHSNLLQLDKENRLLDFFYTNSWEKVKKLRSNLLPSLSLSHLLTIVRKFKNKFSLRKFLKFLPRLEVCQKSLYYI